MAKLKNSKPKQKMGLHKWIAVGGLPQNYRGCVDDKSKK